MKKLSVIACALILSACASAPRIAAPNQIKSPTPIVGTSGKYMSPFTEDGTVAVWVEKGKSARAGSSVGAFVGAQAGQKLAENIPLFGSFVGKAIGESAGRAIALKMVGGEEFIRANSDISFNSVQDMAVYMYVNNSAHKDFAEALSLTQEIYPEMKTQYYAAITAASANVK